MAVPVLRYLGERIRRVEEVWREHNDAPRLDEPEPAGEPYEELEVADRNAERKVQRRKWTNELD